jgi:class 3 adenylate cyclase/tetratricopeptide (TPR) repeat protein
VTCSSCGFNNPAGMKFCGECGAAADANCPTCEAQNPAGFKFCGGCGNALGESKAPVRAPNEYTPRHLADKILQSKSALEGERKRVTVLFADVKGSMELAQRTDPEQWHKILDRFFSILSDGVHRFEGTVNQYTGDGIMALFGAPIAHEDHAQRACFASLHLRDELKKYAEELRLSQGLDFAVRIGINSGDVVVGKIGDDLRMDYTAQGHTVGLAQRMEQMAAAHSICLSQTTAKLVSGYFAVRDLGEASIKGIDEPLHVYELEGMGDLQTRFDVSRARGLSRFVGRENDMEMLDNALDAARAGTGQVIGVVADAGTGKSRLCFEFAERCRAKGMRVNSGSGVPHGKNIPLLPILQVFRSYYGISDEDDDRAAREKIAGRMLLIDESFRDSLPYVFDFMGMPDPQRPAPAMDPNGRQKVLFGVMRRLVESRGTDDPVITLIEDLHWVDAGTETWLEQMVDLAASTRTLLLVNFRPEYHAGWMQKSYYRQLPLLPLGPDAVQELLTDLLGVDDSIAGLGRAIHARTAGNPFFTEEVAQALIEAGNLAGTKGNYKLVTPIERLTVPSTVQSVLAARIDRLGEREKQVLQTASVIGKEFAEPILASVAQLTHSDLEAALQKLKDGEFVYQQSLYPVSEFAFKHPLTQEVALGSQLRERRSRLHGEVAAAIREAQPDRLDEFSALLAHHYEEAGETLEAVRFHRRAALRLAGVDQTGLITHWQKVHVLSKTLPATREAMEHTLEACHMLLSNGWRTGLTEEEWESLGAEGKLLAERLEDRQGLYSIEAGLSLSHYLCGYVADGIPAGERALAIAEELGDLESRVGARNIMINLHWHGGRFDRAIAAIEEAQALADEDNSLGMDKYGLSIPNWFGGMHGRIELWRGNPAASRALLDKCSQTARKLGQQEVVSWSICGLIELAWTTGVSDQALTHAQRILEIAEQIGSPLSEAIGHFGTGVAHLLRDEPEAARAPLERMIWFSTERRVFRSWQPIGQAMLADAYLASGDAERATETAQQGIEFARRAKSYCFGITAELALARVLRTLDANTHRAEIESGFGRCDELLTLSQAHGLVPFIAEERARLEGALGASDADNQLREAQRLYAAVDATGHVARLEAELA